MKKNTILKAMFLLFFSLYLNIHAQSLLWHSGDISQNEEKLLEAFKKYQKSPSKEKRKTEFLTEFKERTAFHNSVIDTIKKEPDDKKDWLNWINRILSLQYIYDTTSPMLTQNNIPQKQFNSVLDSVRTVAVRNLYAQGVKVLDDRSESNHYARAYRKLIVVQQLHPGYEKTEELLQGLKLEANKTAYLKPLEMSNQGNYFTVSLGSSSMDEYVRGKITNDINQKVVGFKIEDQGISLPDYEISLDWKNINLNNNADFKNTFERTAKMNNNTVKASVTYDTQKFSIASSFEVIIKDKTHGRIIDSRVFSAGDFADYVTVSYTGDQEALTHDDLEKINASRFANAGSFKQDFINSFYDHQLHPLICGFIIKTLGW
ncbi:hypothetical protein CLU96_2631 [Chryseobacterium sp. 52]|uniref:hypothetical protein n=1 Tax=Chryseobacterium sp. 52 TaxID=2035213 RepID=UPI000C18A3FB|nr:hypothetical protein [Chryseobacterium sp. 52]PIF45622.1 hypothetical protein CLU96_2631 [Chryseobacterium sp. 52]